MFYCDRCNGEFDVFETPGKCPMCAQWITVECGSCAHSATALRFIEAGYKCPKCHRAAKVPGRSKTSLVLVAGVVAVILAFCVLIYVFATLEPKKRDLPDIPRRPIEIQS